MLLKTNVFPCDQHIPPSTTRLCGWNRKLLSLHEDNSIIKWDTQFAFVPEFFMPPFDDELTCVVVFQHESERDSDDDDCARDPVVLFGSSSGHIYQLMFVQRKLVQVEQTFGGAVVDMKRCCENLVAVISQDKLLRIYGWEYLDDGRGNKGVDAPVNLTVVTSVKGSKQGPEAIYSLSSFGNSALIGSLNVILYVSWKNWSGLKSGVSNIEFFPVPKDIKSGKKAKIARNESTFDSGGHKDVAIRSVVFLEDSVCVTGDNFGRSMWWDLNSGTVMQTIRSHSAAVTCLASATPNQVIASGVDSRVIIFALISTDTWAQSVVFKSVPSEVTSLVFVQDPANSNWNLLIGNKSPYLFYWDLQPDSSQEIVPFLRNYDSKVVEQTRQVLVPKPKEISIHRLGEIDENCKLGDVKYRFPQSIPLQEASVKQLVVKVPDYHVLIGTEMSGDGKWLCYASIKLDHCFLKLFQVVTENDEITLSKVPLNAKFSTLVHAVFFMGCSKQLVCLFVNGSLLIYNLLKGGKPKPYQLGASQVLNSVYSKQLGLLACVCEKKHIRVFDLNKKLQLCCDLPVRSAYPVSLAFSTKDEMRPSLFVNYSDYVLVEFDVSNGCFKHWCEALLKSSWGDFGLTRMAIGQSLAHFCDGSEEKVVYNFSRGINVITPDRVGAENWLRTTKAFTLLKNFCVLSRNEMVVFVLPVEQINRNLPAGFSQKVFGT